MNGTGKTELRWIVGISAGLIFGLITTVWAITWQYTERKADLACIDNQRQDIEIAEIRRDNAFIMSKLNEIHVDLKKMQDK